MIWIGTEFEKARAKEKTGQKKNFENCRGGYQYALQ